ncbi:MAG: hypothetical protein C5B47_01520 [Verrucomicrobia bacterium]|nr:MAG: hypothetical protein C5B47_01520 [Verrucomicrobiota bacterium]
MSPQPDLPTTLRKAQIGENLQLLQLDGEPAFCQRLREMGLCESVCLRKVSDGACLICLVRGVRLALSRRLADKIIVTSHSTNGAV